MKGAQKAPFVILSTEDTKFAAGSLNKVRVFFDNLNY